MTVKELIESLKKFDENKEVVFDGNFFFQGYRAECEIKEEKASTGPNYIVIEISE